MEDLPTDLKAFILNHPFLQLTDSKKVKCTLNDHEFPCDLTELQKFTNGKNYKKLSSVSEFNYSQYEPHIVESTKQPKQLFCKLTLRHLNRQPHHVLRHVNGKRFKKALGKYEKCMQQGIPFVPIRLQQKKPRNFGGEEPRLNNSRQGCSTWEPSSNEEDQSESEDSMSDLYPSTMFSLKKSEGGEVTAKDGPEDDFETDDEEDEEEVMEVEEKLQKRRKVQGSGLQKKFKNNNWKNVKKGNVPS